MRDRGEMELELGDSLPPQHKQASKQSRNRGVIAADKKRDWDGSRQLSSTAHNANGALPD